MTHEQRKSWTRDISRPSTRQVSPGSNAPDFFAWADRSIFPNGACRAREVVGCLFADVAAR
jgi:hypothetical protein